MRRILIAASCLACAGPALANDSTASTAAGGLVLQKSESIAMESEDLFLSVDQVRVGYRFRNLSKAPVTTIIAFPMPPRKLYDEFGGDIAYPRHFRTSVNGKPIKATLERKAMAKGKNQTVLLKSLGIPVTPDRINDATVVMDRLPPAKKAELLRLGLVFEEEWDDDGNGMKKHLVPQWEVHDSYWWRQVFPAGRELVINHLYVPGAGGSVDSFIAYRDSRGTPDSQKMVAEYCIDKSFIAAVDARRGTGENPRMMPDRWIDYVLTTGANWAKPIGSFRLVVDKGKAGNLVSFCGDGVKKISPTQFEMKKSDWRPDKDLHILIIQPQS